MRKQTNRCISILKLRLDISLVWLLVYVVVRVGEGGSPNGDVCRYVGERYGWRADLYRDLGKLKRSITFRRKAEFFLGQDQPGGGAPPPAAALAMPIPEPPVLTNAIGFWLGAKRGTT